MDSVGQDSWDFHNLVQNRVSNKWVEVDITVLLRRVKDKTKVIALGNVVSDVCTKYDIPHIKIAHPSGLNRKLNDKAYVEKMLADLKAYLHD